MASIFPPSHRWHAGEGCAGVLSQMWGVCPLVRCHSQPGGTLGCTLAPGHRAPLRPPFTAWAAGQDLGDAFMTGDGFS